MSESEHQSKQYQHLKVNAAQPQVIVESDSMRRSRIERESAPMVIFGFLNLLFLISCDLSNWQKLVVGGISFVALLLVLTGLKHQKIPLLSHWKKSKDSIQSAPHL
jgi:hypothetical protein